MDTETRINVTIGAVLKNTNVPMNKLSIISKLELMNIMVYNLPCKRLYYSSLSNGSLCSVRSVSGNEKHCGGITLSLAK